MTPEAGPAAPPQRSPHAASPSLPACPPPTLSPPRLGLGPLAPCGRHLLGGPRKWAWAGGTRRMGRGATAASFEQTRSSPSQRVRAARHSCHGNQRLLGRGLAPPAPATSLPPRSDFDFPSVVYFNCVTTPSSHTRQVRGQPDALSSPQHLAHNKSFQHFLAEASPPAFGPRPFEAGFA